MMSAATKSLPTWPPDLTTAADPNALFATEDRTLSEIWDAIQRHQVDFAFDDELQVYDRSDWWAARSVLDLGTGNGYYLRRLAGLFPDKQYLGLDSSRELIAIAERSAAPPGVRWQCADLASADGKFDFVIMRLLLQHQEEVEGVLRKVAELARPGGTALVIDARDEARVFRPELPAFRALFRAYTESQARKGRLRTVGARVLEEVRRDPRWRVGERESVTISSARPGNLAEFRTVYALFIDLVERAGGVDCDFDRVRAEWRWWCGLDDAHAEAGLDVLRLHRA